MECRRCGSKWKIPAGITIPVRCPFCGAELFNRYYDDYEMLNTIIETYGVDVLEERKRLLALLADLFISFQKEQTSLRMAINEGIADYFVKAYYSDSVMMRNSFINRAYKYALDELGMNEKRVEYIINAFSYALGWKNLNVEKTYADADNAYCDLAYTFLEKNDIVAAKQILKISMDAGNEKALLTYIRILHKYPDSSVSKKMMFELNRRTADMDAISAFEMAEYYAYGKIKDRDLEEAYRLYLKCRDLGIRYDEYFKRYKLYECYDKIPEILYDENIKKVSSHAGTELVLRQLFLIGTDTALGSCAAAWADDELGEYIDDYLYRNEFWFSVNDLYITIIGTEPEDIEEGKILTLEALIEYYTARNQKEKLRFWLEIGVQNHVAVARILLGKIYLNSKNKKTRDKVYELLSQEAYGEYGNPEAQFVLAQYFQKEGDIRTAFEMYEKCANTETEANYELGKMYFYGLECTADRKKTIQYLETYLDRMKESIVWQIYSEEYQESFLIKTLPYLAQCYFEELLTSDSAYAFEKLKVYAEDYHSRLAQRYLIRYYKDEDSVAFDPEEAKRYELSFAQVNAPRPGKEREFLKGLKVKNLEGMKNCFQYMFSMWRESMHLFSNYMINIELTEDTEYLPLLYWADKLLDEEGSEEKLRASIYLKTYLELADESDDNYKIAFHKLGDYYSDDSCSASDLERAFKYYKKAEYYGDNYLERFKRESNRVYEMFVAWKYIEERNFFKAVPYFEKAVVKGYRGNYSCIGFAYLHLFTNSKHNPDFDLQRGGYWLERFYKDYINGNINENVNTVVQVEMCLGLCYIGGKGMKKNKDKAILFFDNFLHHVTDMDQELLVEIGNAFRNSDTISFNRNAEIQLEKDRTLAYKFLQKAADYNNSNACLSLAEMFEEDRNISEANIYYKKAADLGNEKAKEWLRFN